MSKIVPISDYNSYSPTRESLVKVIRQMADDIENEAWGDVRNVICLIETTDGQLHRQTFGEAIDLARAIGLLTIAAVRAS